MMRNRGNMFLSKIRNEVFMLNRPTLQSLLTLGSVDVTETAKDEVLYEEVGNVAVISIDGSMAKKTQNGLCMSVYGYDTIANYLSKAEDNPKIDTAIFRVDSPGGHVAGVDDLEDRIFKSPLNTITLYENTGASAAVYAFSASDEIYATKSTEVGSIGVLATVAISKEEPTHMAIVSQNAENKVCDMENGCYDRLQAKLDTYEQMFLSTVSKNTGLDKETIISGFNNGETIFAKDALELGFLDGIITFHDLLNDRVMGAIPTVANNKIVKSNKGSSMTEEEFQAQLQAMTEENETLTAQVNGFDEVLTTAINAAVEETLTTMTARVREGFEYKANVETIVAMLQAESDVLASNIVLNAERTEAIRGADGAESTDTYKQALEAKAKKILGV